MFETSNDAFRDDAPVVPVHMPWDDHRRGRLPLDEFAGLDDHAIYELTLEIYHAPGRGRRRPPSS